MSDLNAKLRQRKLAIDQVLMANPLKFVPQ